MDRTTVNLASILIGGAGLFTVLTGFNTPQLNMSFLGENPFAVKRDVIESTMNWVFSIVALSGLVLQFWAEIWGANLPDRSHGTSHYIAVSVAGLAAVVVLVLGVTGFGNWVAKWQWQPRVIALQHEVFDRASFVVDHQGWTPEHWANREAITTSGDAVRCEAENLRQAEEDIAQIENLLELEARGDLGQRLAALRPLFFKMMAA